MTTKKTDFEQLNQCKSSSLVAELMQFAMENKKWWLLPIFAVLLMVSLLILLSGSGAAPFIYSLF